MGLRKDDIIMRVVNERGVDAGGRRRGREWRGEWQRVTRNRVGTCKTQPDCVKSFCGWPLLATLCRRSVSG